MPPRRLLGPKHGRYGDMSIGGSSAQPLAPRPSDVGPSGCAAPQTSALVAAALDSGGAGPPAEAGSLALRGWPQTQTLLLLPCEGGD